MSLYQEILRKLRMTPGGMSVSGMVSIACLADER